jgi:BirA family biotin operon repressor/biotin-[acetyl-CoA-carboxylase] ligase
MYKIDKINRVLETEFGTLCQIFEKYYLMLKSGKRDILKNNYMESMYGFHQRIPFKGKDSFKGRIVGIDEHGKLGIESEGTIKYYGFKEVAYVR